MNRKWPMLMFGLFGLVLLSCGVTDTVISNVAGGSKGNTVASLWSDVPTIPGAQKQSLELPISMQLAIQGLIKASAASGDVNLDRFDWIAYTTSQTPVQVTALYSHERMLAAGWSSDNQPGCSSGSDTSGLGGGFCIFARGKAPEKQSVLFIILAQDESTKQTQVYYVRMDGNFTGTPTRSP